MTDLFQVLTIAYTIECGNISYGVLSETETEPCRFLTGLSKEKETKDAAARREIFRKTGFRPRKLMPLLSVFSVPAKPNKNRGYWQRGVYVMPSYSFAYECDKSTDEQSMRGMEWLSYEEARERLTEESYRVALYELNCVLEEQKRRDFVKTYMGEEIDVVIDRPKGSRHPIYRHMVYPVHYGFVPETVTQNGQPQEVYLLGVTEPVEHLRARVIGIIHRENDVADKLVAAPEGVRLHQGEIAERVYFQEKYYKTSVDAVYQKSCGAVLYRKKEGLTEYLLLKQSATGAWSFPKGHMERREREKETATREILEETGLMVRRFDDFRQEVHYTIANRIKKTVVLFAAEVRVSPRLKNKQEITEYCWADAKKAKEIFPPCASVIDRLEAMLSARKTEE